MTPLTGMYVLAAVAGLLGTATLIMGFLTTAMAEKSATKQPEDISLHDEAMLGWIITRDYVDEVVRKIADNEYPDLPISAQSMRSRLNTQAWYMLEHTDAELIVLTALTSYYHYPNYSYRYYAARVLENA